MELTNAPPDIKPAAKPAIRLMPFLVRENLKGKCDIEFTSPAIARRASLFSIPP